MGIVTGLKYKKSGGVPIGVAELEPGDQLAPSIIAGLMGRNALINGDFRFWQRRTAYTQATTGQGYCADRWVVAGVTANHAVTQQVMPLAANDNTYYQQSVVSGVTSASAAYTGQYIEDVHTFAGKTVTVSATLWGTAGNKVGVRLLQSFGTGGSAVVVKELGVWTITASQARYELSVTLDSIAGKTIGANSSLYLVFDYCAAAPGHGGALVGQVGTFNLSEVTVERGESASAFERRPDAIELILCQRYYEKSFNLTTAPGNSVQAGLTQATAVWGPNGNMTGYAPFKVQKRTTPAMVFYSPNEISAAAGAWAYYNYTTSLWSATLASVQRVNEWGASIGNTVASSPPAAGLAILICGHWAADAEI